MPPAVAAAHWEYSGIWSLHDDPSAPTTDLIDVACASIAAARKIDLSDLASMLPPNFGPLPNLWPGDHYRLLAGIVEVIKPQQIIEIGTSAGVSALSMRRYMPAGGKLTTFDITPWRKVPGTILNDDHFRDGAMVQLTDNLTTKAVQVQHRSLFEQADMILVDAAKDGIMEREFIKFFNNCTFRNAPLVVFDDIKTWMMLNIWRSLRVPKLDLTSFGHFTGTGICRWDRTS